MKLPQIGIILGLLLGIAATAWLRPETAAGAALLIIVATLVVSLAALAVDRLRGRS